jgi:hypothetical protein
VTSTWGMEIGKIKKNAKIFFRKEKLLKNGLVYLKTV